MPLGHQKPWFWQKRLPSSGLLAPGKDGAEPDLLMLVWAAWPVASWAGRAARKAYCPPLLVPECLCVWMEGAGSKSAWLGPVCVVSFLLGSRCLLLYIYRNLRKDLAYSSRLTGSFTPYRICVAEVTPEKDTAKLIKHLFLV